MTRSLPLLIFAFASLSFLYAQQDSSHAGPVEPRVLSQPIGRGLGAFEGPLDAFHAFGFRVAPIGDFNSDGTPDIASVALGDYAGGALWILYLDRQGRVVDEQKISPETGGFIGGPEVCGCVMADVASLGDLDGDGITDLVVGAPSLFGLDHDQRPGGLFVLFMNPDATVRSQVEISEGIGGLQGVIRPDFGYTLTSVGDLDGDGLTEIAVDAGPGLLLLFLRSDGTVRSQQEIAFGLDGLPAPGFEAGLGFDVAPLGDFDGDGVPDLVASGTEYFARQNPQQVVEFLRGHVWLLLLHPDGRVKASSRFSSSDVGIELGFAAPNLVTDGSFGTSVAALGDLDGNGVVDLAVSTQGGNEGPEPTGSIWIVQLLADGGVRNAREITGGTQPYDLPLRPFDDFGNSLAVPGDLDGDGRVELVAGAPGSMVSPFSQNPLVSGPLGLLWVLFGDR